LFSRYWQRSFSATNDATGGLLAGTWNTLLGGATVNSSTLSRANAISYTSPTFGGFSVSAAWGEDDVWDAALRYAGEFSGFRVAAGVGYIANSSGLNEVTPDQDDCALPAAGKTATCRPNQWKGSASILHVATGFFATGAYVRQDNASQTRTLQGTQIERPETQLFYLQGGIRLRRCDGRRPHQVLTRRSGPRGLTPTLRAAFGRLFCWGRIGHCAQAEGTSPMTPARGGRGLGVIYQWPTYRSTTLLGPRTIGTKAHRHLGCRIVPCASSVV
jgi:hypothetical protein